MDAVAVEKAERELDRFIDSQVTKRKGEDKANLDAAIERAADARKHEAQQQENRVLWIHHYRKLAAINLQTARDYRSRARRLEQGETA